jgi:uncharacterized protein (TIGR03067 family)
VHIAKDTITVRDKDKKETFHATYKVSTTARPWGIAMESVDGPDKGQIAKGLVHKEGDTLKLIYALPGGDAPTDFKTRDKQMMFTLKKKS